MNDIPLTRNRGRARKIGKDGFPKRLNNANEIIARIHFHTNGKVTVKDVENLKSQSSYVTFVDENGFEFISTPSKICRRKRAPISHKKVGEIRTAKSIAKARAIASGCATLTEFRTIYHKHYITAFRNGILKELTREMFRSGSKHYRYVYSISLANVMYFGLTMNPQQRFNAHRTRGVKKVRRLINDGGVLTILTPIIDHDLAAKIEIDLIMTARKLGIVVLNTHTGGGLGGATVKWTPDKVREEAQKYSTRSEFLKNSNGAYASARKHNLMDELFPIVRSREKRLRASIIAGGRPFTTTNLHTGETRTWDTQADFVDETGLTNISGVLRGKNRTIGKGENRYTAKWIPLDSSSPIL